MANNQLYIYSLLKQAIDQNDHNSQEELSKLMAPISANPNSMKVKIRFSVETKDGKETYTEKTCVFDAPKLDTYQPHATFQSSMTEDMARMLQHAF